MPINIRGKEYTTVPERLQLLQNDKNIERYELSTYITYEGEDIVRCKAIITLWSKNADKADNAETPFYRYATGHAEEVRSDKSSMVNRTAAVENAETSAIGRALRHLGYASDGDGASAEEILLAQAREKEGRFAKKNAPSQLSPLEAKATAVADTKRVLIYKLIKKAGYDPEDKVTIESIIGMKITPKNYDDVIARLDKLPPLEK